MCGRSLEGYQSFWHVPARNPPADRSLADSWKRARPFLLLSSSAQRYLLARTPSVVPNVTRHRLHRHLRGAPSMGGARVASNTATATPSTHLRRQFRIQTRRCRTFPRARHGAPSGTSRTPGVSTATVATLATARASNPSHHRRRAPNQSTEMSPPPPGASAAGRARSVKSAALEMARLAGRYAVLLRARRRPRPDRAQRPPPPPPPPPLPRPHPPLLHLRPLQAPCQHSAPSARRQLPRAPLDLWPARSAASQERDGRWSMTMPIHQTS